MMAFSCPKTSAFGKKNMTILLAITKRLGGYGGENHCQRLAFSKTAKPPPTWLKNFLGKF